MATLAEATARPGGPGGDNSPGGGSPTRSTAGERKLDPQGKKAACYGGKNNGFGNIIRLVSTRPNHAPLRWFADIGLVDSAHVGTKAASLGELQRAGIRVPPGFAVTTSAFERAVDTLDRAEPFRPRIAALSPADDDGIARLCREIRRRIQSTPLPVDLHALVVEAYRALCPPEANGVRSADVPVAVRSSTRADAGAEARALEPHDTFLWVRGIEGVTHAIRSCWGSLYTVDAVKERLRRNLPESHVAMGVVVQRMVNSQCSGVMSTRCVLTGDPSLITIEGTWGLGSAIVTREVQPDRFIVSKVTGEIVKRTILEKGMQHLPDHFAGGVRHEAVPVEQQKMPCLTDAQIAGLAHLAKLVERRFGVSQNIEWAIDVDEHEAVLLQCQPEASSLLQGSGGSSADRVVPIANSRPR